MRSRTQSFTTGAHTVSRSCRLLTVTAEVAVSVVKSLGVFGDLFDRTVLAHAGHIVGLLELVTTVHATHKNHLVLQTQRNSQSSQRLGLFLTCGLSGRQSV